MIETTEKEKEKEGGKFELVMSADEELTHSFYQPTHCNVASIWLVEGEGAILHVLGEINLCEWNQKNGFRKFDQFLLNYCFGQISSSRIFAVKGLSDESENNLVRYSGPRQEQNKHAELAKLISKSKKFE